MSTDAPTRPAPATVKMYVPSGDEMNNPTNIVGLQRMSPFIARQMDLRLPNFLRGNADRLVRALFTCVQKVPALMNCTPLSLFGGVIQAGELGLELGSGLGQAYLIPYKDQATFVLGYKGALTLAHRSTLIRNLTPIRVREGDGFSFRQGSDRGITHTPVWNSKAPVIAYYVLSEMTNGGRDFEIASFDEMVEFRDRYSSSRSAPQSVRDRSPWYDMREGLGWNGFDWMAAKTLMKRIGKRLPVSVEFQRAISLVDEADAGIPQDLGRLVDTGETPTVESDLDSRLKDAKATPLQRHARAYEEADDWPALNAAIAAAVADKSLADADRKRLDDLAEQRKYDLEGRK